MRALDCEIAWGYSHSVVAGGFEEIGRHRVLRGDGPDHDRIGVGATVALNADRADEWRGYLRVMSEENVEVFRAVFEAWNAGDMDAFRDRYDPHTVMRAPEGWPEAGPLCGRDAVMRQWHELRATWHGDTVEPISDFIEAGDRVIVRQVWHAASRGPDARFEMTNVVTLRKGRIIYQEFFWDHEEALETLGLSE